MQGAADMKNVKWFAIGLVGLSSLYGAPAFADKWVYVLTNIDGTAVYYDPNTVRRSGNTVSVLEKWDKSRNEAFPWLPEESRAFVRYDCYNWTRTYISGVGYFSDGRTQSEQIEPYQQLAEDVLQNPTWNRIARAICRLGKGR